MSIAQLTGREITHHGAVFGGLSSDKTTFLQLLIERTAGRIPVVVADPKGSPALADTAHGHGGVVWCGVVWTLEEGVPADLLDPRQAVRYVPCRTLVGIRGRSLLVSVGVWQISLVVLWLLAISLSSAT
jgi:hypothetical protein